MLAADDDDGDDTVVGLNSFPTAVVVVSIVVDCGLTGNAAAVLPGEFVLLLESAAEPEFAFDIPRQNAKHFTLFCDSAEDADSDFAADAEFDVEWSVVIGVDDHDVVPSLFS